ncbi:MAG: 1-acyl-sn-glycerol-3-phosphate acyltransferase [Acidobacteria bacterium]|nr:1-acyl-sn-glycerol-3-phosphate acyltransferase [Acidobacteriota bacterium]
MPFWTLNLLRPLVRLFSRIFFRIEFRGEEHIPLAGPLIITPNHVTYLDPFLVSIPIRRRIYYMTWDRIFHIPVISTLARLLGAFPVRIDVADKSALARSLRHLGEQAAVMIFPEGGRTPDGRLQRFRNGAFRLALGTGAALLPVSISGAFAVWPKHRRWPRPGNIRITYHSPVLPRPFQTQTPENFRQESRRLASEVHDSIQSALDPIVDTPAPASR